MVAIAAGRPGDHKASQFIIGIARGVAGALLFALPMLMTMEMWFLGLYVNRTRLLLLCILNLPLLWVLAKRIGFEKTEPPRLCRRPQLVRSRVYDKQNDEQIFS